MDKEVVYIYGLVEPTTKELRYVGKSKNPKVRLRKHISERFKHDSYKDRWIRKMVDSESRPELIIIDEVLKEEWQYWERHYIAYYRGLGVRLTNSTDGGDQPPSTKGRKHTEESKRKMSEAKKGKAIPWLNNGEVRSQEHRDNLSKAIKGRISPNKGKKVSTELRKKLADASTSKKKVKQLDLDGNFIKMWDSVNEVQKEMNLRHISECCRGVSYKTVGGFKWEYEKRIKYEK